jgi:alpha-ketoglutarate-dependent taurine dioxygenase
MHACRRLAVGSPSDLTSEEKAALLNRFQQVGFVVVRPTAGGDPREHLLALSGLFGDRLDHRLADDDGVVTISPDPELARFGHAFSHRGLELHTDGAFSRQPPNVVALQCETPSSWGGASRLVDAKALYAHLASKCPHLLPRLFDHDAMTVTRAGETATQPIFSLREERVQICFRLDPSVEVSFEPEVKSLVPVIQSFLENPASQEHCLLAAGEILVVDNRRILHGRSAFGPSHIRRMNRLWLNGASSEDLRFGFDAKGAELGLERRTLRTSCASGQ